VGGRYELEALIGKGGAGEVWRARHVALNSRVAIKFLQMASAEKESAKRRFTTEAQVAAQLKSPNAVQVFDFGISDNGQPYLVMELLEGETLGRRLERSGRLAPAEAVRVLGQAARALHRAHQLGIVHRDFKPDNIVIYPDDEGHDQVKVLDFGIAKLVGALDEPVSGEDSGELSSFTRTGAVLGTPLYMAPEQIRDPAAVDLRADIWAFGVVAYECLAGRPPFKGASFDQLFEKIQAGLHPAATFVEPTIPRAFDMWFDIACAPDATKRFGSAAIAYRHLAIALDVGVVGDPNTSSFSGVSDPFSSGERRVLVVGGAAGTDESAPTLDAHAAIASGEVLGRTHDGFSSLQLIRVASIEADAVGARPRSAPPRAAGGDTAAPADPLPLPASRRALRVGTVAVGAIAVIAAGVVLWQVASRPASIPAESAAATGGASAPGAAPTGSASASAPASTTPAQAPTPTPTPTAVASPAIAGAPGGPAAQATISSQAPPAARGAVRKPTAGTVAGASAASPAPSPAAPPAAPPPAAPPTQQPTSVDPGSYR
jgi:serine/threonine protein kinase